VSGPCLPAAIAEGTRGTRAKQPQTVARRTSDDRTVGGHMRLESPLRAVQARNILHAPAQDNLSPAIAADRHTGEVRIHGSALRGHGDHRIHPRVSR